MVQESSENGGPLKRPDGQRLTRTSFWEESTASAARHSVTKVLKIEHDRFPWFACETTLINVRTIAALDR